MSAVPANHGLSTAKGMVNGRSKAVRSRVLISIFRRIGTPLPSSAATLKKSFGATALLPSNCPRPSQGSSTARS